MVTLSGCLSDGSGDTESENGLGSALGTPTAYSIACPPGATVQRYDEVCVREIRDLLRSLHEPYLAVDPSNPDRIAIGVNEGQSTEIPDAAYGRSRATIADLALYVSPDGGATWSRTSPPEIPPPDEIRPAQVHIRGDPAFLFDPDGTLHFTGIVIYELDQALIEGPNGYGIFYTNTTDLGATWSEPTMITLDGNNDRNWLARGPDDTLYLTWTSLGEGSEIAWSQDHGKTWEHMPEGKIAEGCFLASPAILLPSGPAFTCGDDDAEVPFIDLYVADTSSGTFEKRSRIEEATRIGYLEALSDGTLVLGTRSGEVVRFFFSDDGGNTWSPALDLGTETDIEEGFVTVEMFWMEVDPWDQVHGIIGAYTVGRPIAFLGVTLNPYEPAAFHVSVDPDTRKFQSASRLTPPIEDGSGQALGDAPRSLGFPFGDHFWGIDFTGEVGHLAWMYQDGIDYTTLEPTWRTSDDSGSERP